MDWNGKKVLVTGSASFIASHLCDRLVELGARVIGVDDLSSGKIENLSECIDKIHFIEEDLFYERRAFIRGAEIVFHLAAVHGGRGYVDKQQCGCSTNLALDNLVFMDCAKYRVKKIIFASSGCVYPNYLQSNPQEELYLREDMVPSVYDGGGKSYDSDKLYGWAKLMAEFTLQAIHKEYGIDTASCRFFTVYGPRAKEDHAVMAMIGRAFIEQNPFEIWGDGTQIRNWTYVDDIVDGLILAAENVTDGRAVNLGTMERITVMEAARHICKIMNHDPEMVLLRNMPTGPLNRVADNTLAAQLLNKGTFISFEEGIKKTIDWYKATKTVEEVKTIFQKDTLINGSTR